MWRRFQINTPIASFQYFNFLTMFKDLVLLFYLYVLRWSIHVHASALGMESEEFVNHLAWMLGPKLRSSREQYVLLTTQPSLQALHPQPPLLTITNFKLLT